MNAFSQVLANTISTLLTLLSVAVVRIVRGRAPMRTPVWVRRWMRRAGVAAEITVGFAGLYLVLSGLILAAGVATHNTITMYVGFTLLALFTIFTKAFLQLLESLAASIFNKLGLTLRLLGIRVQPTHPSVHKALTDTGMLMILCSVIALDGPGTGLMLPAIAWFSLASLAAIVIMSQAEFSIRRRLMVAFAAMYVILRVLFALVPELRDIATVFVTVVKAFLTQGKIWLLKQITDAPLPIQITLGLVAAAACFGFAYMVIRWIYMSIPTGGPTAQQNQTAQGGTAATTATTAHTTHTGSGFNWKALGVAVAVVVGLGLLAFIAFGRQTPAVASSSGVITTSAVVTPAAPAPYVVHAVPLPVAATAASPQSFQEIASTPDIGEFQLDARVIWQELPLTVSEGDVITWSAKGQGCQEGTDGKGSNCVDSNGFDLPGMDPWAEDSMVKPEQYAVGHAYLGELVMEVGGKKFQAGPVHTSRYVVPAGVQGQPIKLMLNTRVPFIGHSSGGPTVTINIARKKA